ncbi:2Fe-2S iron-sulfur cluster-binding protein [Desulforhopalus sp. 52FAK]
MSKIHINNYGVTVPAIPGRSLLVSLLNEEQPIYTICGGKAGCGCCRVKILQGAEKLSLVNDNEKRRLGSAVIENGFRLACQTYLLRDVTIYLPTGDELDSICSKRLK